jgi:hypothetical protein
MQGFFPQIGKKPREPCPTCLRLGIPPCRQGGYSMDLLPEISTYTKSKFYPIQGRSRRVFSAPTLLYTVFFRPFSLSGAFSPGNCRRTAKIFAPPQGRFSCRPLFSKKTVRRGAKFFRKILQ